MIDLLDLALTDCASTVIDLLDRRCWYGVRTFEIDLDTNTTFFVSKKYV